MEPTSRSNIASKAPAAAAAALSSSQEDVFRLLSRGVSFSRRGGTTTATTATQQQQQKQKQKRKEEEEREVKKRQRRSVDAKEDEEEEEGIALFATASAEEEEEEEDNRRRKTQKKGEEEEEESFAQKTQSARAAARREGVRVEGNDVPTPLAAFRDAVPLVLSAVNAEKASDADEDDEEEEEDPKKKEKAAAPKTTAAMRRRARKRMGRVLENVAGAGLREPTAVQRHAGAAVAAGREVVGVAPTGTGKTLAFALPILLHGCAVGEAQRRAFCRRRVGRSAGEEGEAHDDDDEVEAAEAGFGAVVLSPTRELAQQTGRVFRQFGQGSGFRTCTLTLGAAEKGRQRPRGWYDVLVATPMRLVRMVEEAAAAKKKSKKSKKKSKKTNLEAMLGQAWMLVLDEADRLFDEQFVGQVDEVAAACKAARAAGGGRLRVSLFSATMQPRVEQLAGALQRDAVRVQVGVRNVPLGSISQRLVFAGRGEAGKLVALRDMLRRGGELPLPVLVFVQAAERAEELRRGLVAAADETRVPGPRVAVLHAGLSAAAREAAVDGVRAGDVWVLVATDVVARGMDFAGVRSVVQFDFPQSVTEYVHRVGRTGRAGRSGTAVTFFTEDDAGMLRTIANAMRAAGCDVPQWMLGLRAAPASVRKRLARHAPQRQSVLSHLMSGAPSFAASTAAARPHERMLVVRRPHQPHSSHSQNRRAAAGRVGTKKKIAPTSAPPKKQQRRG